MALQAYLKIDGIATTGNLNGIELESFSWGVSNADIGSQSSGAGAGKVAFSDFNFTAKLGNHSPMLFEKCVEGYHIQTAMLSITGAPSQIWIKFGDVLISSYQLGDSSMQKVRDATSFKTSASADVPQESVSLNFAKIEYNFGGTIGTGGVGGTKGSLG
jgi:type VI secretion system secreted protein Hcp